MKFLSILMPIICLLSYNVQGQERFIFNPLDFIDSAASVVTDLGSQLAQTIFSPTDTFLESKQILFGLPEVAVLGALHELCSLFMSSGMVDPLITPEINEMYFQLRTPCRSISYPIRQVKKILEIKEFDVNKPVVLFISGWTSSIESDSISYVAKAYNCRGGYNFLALNASDFIDTLYTWSAFNTDALGRIVAKGLVQLHTKVPTKNIHLVGFSLGAHIAGFAGRYFEQFTGKKIHRITGLDPANPCFGEDESLAGLQRGDAKFVDVIHTNPGAFGKSDQLGDVDFYVQGLAPIQPGCMVLGCSHIRAWKYYAESVYPGKEMNFMATRCSTLARAEDGLCTGAKIPMGLSVPLKTRGIYTLSVNSQTPYGKSSNDNGQLILSKCGFCRY